MSPRPTAFRLISAVCGAWALAGVLPGCGGPQATPLATPDEFVPRAIEPLVRKACPPGVEQLMDASADGLANVRHVSAAGKRVCSEYDLNLDGKIDVLRVYADDGRPTFEQHDFDFDGRLDQQAFFDAGKLMRKELDTNFDRMVDTWVWCEGPLIARLERDRQHTGRVDTWEQYLRGQLSEVSHDDNNDGRVERWETYHAGRLHKVAFDGDLDGKPDSTEMQSVASAPAAMEPVTCNGNAIEQLAASAAPRAPAPPPAAPAAPVAPEAKP